MEVSLIVLLLLRHCGAGTKLVPGPSAAEAGGEPNPLASFEQLTHTLAPALHKLLGDAAGWGLGVFQEGQQDSGAAAAGGPSASGSDAAGAQAQQTSGSSAGGRAAAKVPSASPAAVAGATAVVAARPAEAPYWLRSGDPDGLLPPCDLLKLVGVKVPAGSCFVRVGGSSGEE